MAKVEDLIKSIPDAQLRDEIAREVTNLKSQKKFGLVFEEHLPEQVLLPGLPIKPGARVVKRGAENEILTVIEPENGSRKTLRFRVASESDGHEEIATAEELIIIKKFGEPIYPTLVPIDDVTRAPGKPYHTIINAENFHALQLLLYCYEGQVDVIYIDPPYNTGARDWKYNNNYVDKTDQFRHSKWLSMMKRRLQLAKRLLKFDGVLVVTIDENEVYHLGALLEELFSEYLRSAITVVINPKGAGRTNFARMDEYAMFSVPNTGSNLISGTLVHQGLVEESEEEEEKKEASVGKESLEQRTFELGDSWDRPFPEDQADLWELRHARRRGNESSYRHQRKNQFYPIYIDPVAGRVVEAGESLPLEVEPSFKKKGGLIPIWPIDEEDNHRCWRFIPDSMNKLISEKRVVLGKFNKKRRTWTLNIWERKPTTKRIKTVWWNSAHDAGTHGTTLLHRILGRRDAFPFPKSVYLVRDTLATIVGNRPNALILDFFAGSGTTGHATFLLNAQDQGSRRCILVSNNEVGERKARALEKQQVFPGEAKYESEGICQAVTWPRCKYVVNGKRDDGTDLVGRYAGGRGMNEGFKENIEYLKLDFLDPNEVAYGDELEAILPILWLIAGGKGKLGRERGTRGSGRWFIPQNSTYAVLIQEDYFGEFKRELKGLPDITHVFLVTDSEEAYREMIAELPGLPKTKMLYKSYLENFRINTERNL